MSVIHQERGITLDARLLVFPVVVVSALIVFLVRLWDLQVVQADELKLKAERSRSTSIALTAPRGLIVDRKGRIVAGVRSQYVVTGIPSVLRKEPEVLARVANVLQVSVATLEKSLADGNWRPNLPTPIFQGATSAQATRLVEDLTLNGIGVTTQPARRYVEPFMLSHVLGYVRAPDEKDVARFKNEGLNTPEYVGKTGIEYTHDFALSGQAGLEEMTIDSRNKPLRTLDLVTPTPGAKLVLGIDLDLQRYAYELLGDRNGCVVAIEPDTGLILCFVSKPSFDANMWLGGLSSEKYAALMNDPAIPLFNRATQTGYMPGSTFKIVVALASYLAGKFDPNRTVFCPGYYQQGKRKTKCLGQHGAINFNRAFEKSCNTYFIATGIAAGAENIAIASKSLGLGQKTGIDLLSELRGIVPNSEWKARRSEGLVKQIEKSTSLNSREKAEKLRAARSEGTWYPGDTTNFSLGQGFVNVTPLQLAVMATGVANHGRVPRPHFVRDVVGQDGAVSKFKPKTIAEAKADAAFWAALDRAMLSVVQSGTARSAQISGIQWGGKTGSAENSRSKTTDSLFVGVAPLPNPKIAIAVVAENAGHGGTVAAPIAGKLIERYLKGAPKADSTRVASRATSSAGAAGSAVN